MVDGIPANAAAVESLMGADKVGQPTREERLAKALRANLARRKGQARAREAARDEGQEAERSEETEKPHASER